VNPGSAALKLDRAREHIADVLATINAWLATDA